jgi:hypothetical protein
MADLFDRMAEKWPAPGFIRSQVGMVTGGLISPKTLANLNSAHEGPPCEIIRGRSFYELETFVPWLRKWANRGSK